MAEPGTKHCPRCNATLSRPGFCPQCGLAVGYGPGQNAPLDEPATALIADDPVTHVDLPPVASSYRWPERSRSPQPPPPVTYEPPASSGPGPTGDRSAFVLPVLGVAFVLALIVGGLWFLTNDDDSDQAADAPAQRSSENGPGPTKEPDGGRAGRTMGPLAVEAAYQNQGCTGRLLVVLASSGDPKADDRTIGAAVDQVPDAKYLRTSRSCETFNQSLNGNPIYAAYVGPFDSIAEACAARTETGIAAAYVRTLSTDRELRDICSCQDEASALPRLSTKTASEPSYDLRLRVYDLQSLLYLAGTNPSNLVTGTFGPETDDMVRSYQREQGLKPDGWVGPQTWGRLLSQNCP